MTFNYYLQKFFGLGSKETVRYNERELLKRLVSVVPQTLTVPEQVQARENIGINLMYKIGNRETLTKGTHTINFTTPFVDPYVVFATGSTALAGVAVVIVDDTDLSHFTVKVGADCTLRWIAYVITEL